MALDIVALREAVAATIRSGIDREVNVYEYEPATPICPAVIIRPSTLEDSVEFIRTMRNPAYNVKLEIWCLTDTGVSSDGQRLLDQMLSAGSGQTTSVRDALDADNTLGGVVESGGLTIESQRHRGMFRWPAESQTMFWVGVIPVTVVQR
jgi:hypothetical protein